MWLRLINSRFSRMLGTLWVFLATHLVRTSFVEFVIASFCAYSFEHFCNTSTKYILLILTSLNFEESARVQSILFVAEDLLCRLDERIF